MNRLVEITVILAAMAYDRGGRVDKLPEINFLAERLAKDNSPDTQGEYLHDAVKTVWENFSNFKPGQFWLELEGHNLCKLFAWELYWWLPEQVDVIHSGGHCYHLVAIRGDDVLIYNWPTGDILLAEGMGLFLDRPEELFHYITEDREPQLYKIVGFADEEFPEEYKSPNLPPRKDTGSTLAGVPDVLADFNAAARTLTNNWPDVLNQNTRLYPFSKSFDLVAEDIALWTKSFGRQTSGLRAAFMRIRNSHKLVSPYTHVWTGPHGVEYGAEGIDEQYHVSWSDEIFPTRRAAEIDLFLTINRQK